MMGGQTGSAPGASVETFAPRERRHELGGLDLSLPPDLGALVRAAAARLGDTPRKLALEILQKVVGEDLVDAVLDRG